MKKKPAKNDYSKRGKINIRTALIKLIYYSTFIMIFLGMLKVINQYNILNGPYNIVRLICLILCYIYLLMFFRRTSNKNIIFILCFLIYEIFVMLITFSFHFPNGIIDVLHWPTLTIVFYDYTFKRDNLKFIAKSIIPFYIVILIISSFLISIHLLGNGNGKFGYVIFPTYFTLSTLPLLLKFKNNKIGIVFLVLSMIIMILTTKRTGFLIALIGIILYYTSSAQLTGNINLKLKKYMKLLFLGSIFLVILNFFGGAKIDNLLYRFNQLSTDEGSGRVEIWNGVINSYQNSTISKKIFGHGTQSVLYNLQPTGRNIFAHNSYIEYLYDYGFIGLTLLVFLNINFLKILNNLKKKKNTDYPSFVYFYIIVIFLSILSYFFEQSYIILPMAIYLGIIVAQKEKNGGTYDKN